MIDVCKLCNNEIDELNLNDKELKIQTSQWDDYYSDWVYETIQINYCPMCGKKLTEKDCDKTIDNHYDFDDFLY